jgi:hypothetical protein
MPPPAVCRCDASCGATRQGPSTIKKTGNAETLRARRFSAPLAPPRFTLSAVPVPARVPGSHRCRDQPPHSAAGFADSIRDGTPSFSRKTAGKHQIDSISARRVTGGRAGRARLVLLPPAVVDRFPPPLSLHFFLLPFPFVTGFLGSCRRAGLQQVCPFRGLAPLGAGRESINVVCRNPSRHRCQS